MLLINQIKLTLFIHAGLIATNTIPRAPVIFDSNLVFFQNKVEIQLKGISGLIYRFRVIES